MKTREQAVAEKGEWQRKMGMTIESEAVKPKEDYMTTIQITLNEDDLNALERFVRQTWNDPDLMAIASHILEQVKLKEQA